MPPMSGTTAVIDRDGLAALVVALRRGGRQVIGPVLGDGAVVYAPMASVDDLPAGWGDVLEGGHYRLRRRDDDAWFGYTAAPQGWKRALFPPRLRLWAGERAGAGFRATAGAEPATPQAFLGVRACELSAIRIQDRVFRGGPFVDAAYGDRRDGALIVAVACGEAAATCFCASMGSGPAMGEGYDLLLTELVEAGTFVVHSGSAAGAALLAALPHRPATPAEHDAADALPARAAAQQQRRMDPEAKALAGAALEHRQWAEVATRCLSCGNCTMVCPTCFCSTVEDATSLDGSQAERVRRWDSCFSIDFSYIHGGSVRRAPAARYRHWIRHKLATWHDQFGTSGCVGCGRCIAWCPVGIDITAEVDSLRAAQGG